jgi:hypothetical protein
MGAETCHLKTDIMLNGGICRVRINTDTGWNEGIFIDGMEFYCYGNDCRFVGKYIVDYCTSCGVSRSLSCMLHCASK